VQEISIRPIKRRRQVQKSKKQIVLTGLWLAGRDLDGVNPGWLNTFETGWLSSRLAGHKRDRPALGWLDTIEMGCLSAGWTLSSQADRLLVGQNRDRLVFSWLDTIWMDRQDIISTSWFSAG
jgi:hypothetical protein